MFIFFLFVKRKKTNQKKEKQKPCGDETIRGFAPEPPSANYTLLVVTLNLKNKQSTVGWDPYPTIIRILFFNFLSVGYDPTLLLLLSEDCFGSCYQAYFLILCLAMTMQRWIDPASLLKVRIKRVPGGQTPPCTLCSLSQVQGDNE